MTNLPAQQNASGFSLQENQLIHAKGQPKIKALHEDVVEDAATVIVAEALATIGNPKIENAVLLKMNLDMQEALKGEFSTLSVEEVQLAIKYGIDEADRLYTLNSKVLRGFVRTWKNTKKLELNKAIAAKNAKAIAAPEAKKYDLEDQLSALKEQFKRYIENKEILVFVYPFLENFGLVFPVEKKLEEMEIAKAFLIKRSKSNLSNGFAQQVKAKIAEFEASTIKKPAAAIIAQAQKQLLIGVFNNCMNECIELDEYFNQIKNEAENNAKNTK